MKPMILVLILFGTAASLAAVIHSTPAGGNWSEPVTWAGGAVPTDGDDVVINGLVLLNSNYGCHDLSLTSGGSLLNHPNVVGGLSVHGNLANSGTISDNATNQLILYCEGHITNSGTFANHHLYLAGASNQNLSNANVFSPGYVTDNNSDSSVTLLADLTLTNTILNLNGANLVLNGAAACDLSLNGGILQHTYLMGGNGATLTLGGGCYLDYVAGNELVLQGTAIIGNMVSFMTLHNYATVYNHISGSYGISVVERLNQHGTIMNNPAGNQMYVTLTGDLYVYGTMSNYLLNLAGPGTTDIFQAAEAPALGCQYIQTGVIDGVYRLLSDLRFSGSNINMGGGTLNLDDAGAGHDLHIGGGYLINAVIDGGENSVLVTDGGCYLSYVSADQITLEGTVIIVDAVSMAQLRNNGTIQNYFNGTYTLSVTQRLDNYGTLRNNPDGNYFYLYLTGDLYNYGSISNQLITLADPDICHLYQDPASPDISSPTIISDSPTCRALSDLRFNNTSLNLYYHTLILDQEGESHNLSVTGGWLSNATLDGGGTSTLTLANSAYLDQVSMDEMILAGTAVIGYNVSAGILHNQGVLQNHLSGTYTLSVTQRLNNYGVIRNNPGGNHFYLYLSGDLYDYGTLANQLVTLACPDAYDVYQDLMAPAITCYYFQASEGSGNCRMLSDLRFSNAYLNFNYKTLILDQDGVSHNLSVSGAYLTNAVLDGGGSSTLTMDDGAYLDQVSMDELILAGTAIIGYNVNAGILHNQGTLQNHVNGSYSLSVTQRLNNHGIIHNNPGGNHFYLYLTGDLYDYGSISNQLTTLAKPALINLYQSETASPIACPYFSASDVSGNLQLLSDLEFAGSMINLYGKALILNSGRSSHNLTVRGGYLYNGSLATEGFSPLELSDGAYLDYMAIEDVILRGTVIIASGVSFDDLVVEGTVWNYPTFSPGLTVNGNLVNHGSIANNPGGNYLFLYCRKDLANYGNIQTHQSFIDGTVDQYLLIGPGSSISCAGGFLLVSEFGSALWFFNGVLPDPNYYTYRAIDPALMGVWQSSNGSNFGRSVILGSGLPLAAPQNVAITKPAGVLKITWNEVDNAIYYNVYASESPFGSYTLLPGRIYDYDLTDGTVWCELEITTAYKFFRITAGN